MFRKIVSVLTLATLVNLLLGCYTNINIEQIRESRIAGEKVLGAVLDSGDKIEFDRQGAEYDGTLKKVAGMTSDGRPVEIGVDRIFYLKVPRQIAGRTFMACLDPTEVKAAVVELPREKISAAILHSGEKTEFSGTGARIDLADGVVRGKTKDGQDKEIAVDEIDHFKVRKFGIFKTIIGVTLLTAVVIGLVSIIGSEDMTKGGPSGPPQQSP